MLRPPNYTKGQKDNGHLTTEKIRL